MREIVSVLISNIEVFYSAIIVLFCALIKKIIRSVKEKMKLKYATIETSGKNSSPPSFKRTKKEYVLNEATNELEELPNEVDFVSKIESYLDCALDRALDRMLNVVGEAENPEEAPIGDYSNHVLDLASLGEAMEIAEEYREKFGLSDNASMAEIYEYVDKEAQRIKGQIQNVVNSKKEEAKNGSVSQTSSGETEKQS